MPDRASKSKVTQDVAGEHLMAVDQHSEFSRVLFELFVRIRPQKLIETGTYLGKGTTLIIARALQNAGLDGAEFHTIEVNPIHYAQALGNLDQAGLLNRVTLHHGLSIPREDLPNAEATRNSTIEGLEGLEIFVDHPQESRVVRYLQETSHRCEDDLLGQVLVGFDGKPDFVLLDSAGHMGYQEFCHLMRHVRGNFYLMLDDVNHLKHYRTVQQIRKDPRFSLEIESPEKFGFALAYFRFDPTQSEFVEAKRSPQRPSSYQPRRVIGIGLVEHMGDIVACEPVVRYLRQEHPTDHIVWCVREDYRELIDNNPHIDETMVVGCLTEWIILCNLLVFDEIIDLHINARVCPTCLIPLKKTRGNLFVNEHTYFHFGTLLSGFAQGAGLPALIDGPKVYLEEPQRQAVDALGLPKEFVTIHATSNEKTKDWTSEKWAELARRLQREFGLPVVELGLESVLPRKQPGVINLCSKLSILETAEVIRRARLFIGIDSGPAHLANAVGTFGLVLLGVYKNFKRYIPFSGDYGNGINAELLYGELVVDLSVEEVFQAAKRSLEYLDQREPYTRIIEEALPPRIPSLEPPKEPLVRAIAFYLPQYHPIEENDFWWGKGFTEWTNVTRTRPHYPGHYQPRLPADLGFYDLRIPEVREAQADLARAHGIHGFCYWHYWFGAGKRLLERPFQEVLRSGKPDFPFCLGWANESWTTRWDGTNNNAIVEQRYPGREDHLRHFQVLLEAFLDPRYIRIDGRPVFLIYRPQAIPDLEEMIDLWRDQAAQAGLSGLYLIDLATVFGQLDPPRAEACFDGSLLHMPNFKTVFQYKDFKERAAVPRRALLPKELLPPLPQGFHFDHRESLALMRHQLGKHFDPVRSFSTVVCTWDNSARVGNLATLLKNEDVLAYEQFLAAEVARVADRPADHRLVFLNAWNEWAEGMHLEPDRRNGTLFLEATARALTGEVRTEKPKPQSVPPLYRLPEGNWNGVIEAARSTLHYGETVCATFLTQIAMVMSVKDLAASIHQKPAESRVSSIQQQKHILGQTVSLLAECSALGMDFNKADRLALFVTNLAPESLELSLATCRGLIKAGLLRTAITAINNHLRANPSAAEARELLTTALVRAGHLWDALVVFADVLRQKPTTSLGEQLHPLVAEALRGKLPYSGKQAQVEIITPFYGRVLGSSDPAQALVANLRSLFPDGGHIYAHFGGLGDLLLLMASCPGKAKGAHLLCVPNSIEETLSALTLFPDWSTVRVLPWPPSYELHVALRKALSLLPGFRGAGVTPLRNDYFEEWKPGLDIRATYRVDLHPGWAARLTPDRRAKPQVVIQPRGGISPRSGQPKEIHLHELQELIAYLNICGIEPVLLYKKQPTETPKGRFTLSADSAIPIQASLIAGADLFVGADSWGKTLAALRGIPAVVFHSTRGTAVDGREEVGDHVFLKPWKGIHVVNDLPEALVALKGLGYVPRSVRYPVRWQGSQFVYHSLAHVNRQLCLGLLGSGRIELSLIPFEPDQFDGSAHPRFSPLVKCLNKTLSASTSVHVRHHWPPNFNPPTQGAWVMIQPWEYGGIPREWVKPMRDLVDEIWVPSTWVRDCYVASGIPGEKVQVIPNGVDTALFNPDGPKFSLKTKKTFKFLFLGGTIHRKGIDILVRAYQKAFRASDDVCLVIKGQSGNTYVGSELHEALTSTVDEDPESPAIEFLNSAMGEGKLTSLYRACDVFVMPYRGEGFGLPMAEAMACGLPVIATGRGAAMDFLQEDWAYFIPSSPQKIDSVPVGPFKPSEPGFWLEEPDESALVDLLRKVFLTPEEAVKKGSNGRAYAVEHLSWGHATERVLERIQVLSSRTPQRFLAKPHREAFLFKPDWTNLAWVEVLIAYTTGFRPGDPVALIVFIDPTEIDLGEAQASIASVLAEGFNEDFADIVLIDNPAEIIDALKPYDSFHWVHNVEAEDATVLGVQARRFFEIRKNIANNTK